ncbi:unnamed protein product [Tuber melanosporum]|uniref:(Perigord truffle) hypothetical protein n=1 Tax=Tuber melanosporum (strain Mel28) TaxID=656061 RepID=D5G431_TUBMM|nr:uncharacterized protein GSTUM_00003928001 [Tuber melanosporum]CAZ79274.1 unnamed protein product [Tuber melanosporum]
MGMPVWKEPVEKRDIDAVLDPRRAAVPRRSAPGRRIRSSQTLMNLLRDDLARETNTLSSIAEGRRERPYPWSELNALPGPVPDPERAGLRLTLADAEARAPSSATSGRGGIRRVRSPLPVFRSENYRLPSSASDTYTPRFPPTFPERQQEEELRRIRTPFPLPTAASSSSEGSSSSSTAPRRAGAEEGSQRRSQYFSRDESSIDETEGGRRDEFSYLTGPSARRWLGIDGLGDRERSLSPDPTHWELVANGLGFQAACDLWESDSDADGNPLAVEVMWDLPPDREEAFRIRRLLSSRNGGIDRLIERL